MKLAGCPGFLLGTLLCCCLAGTESLSSKTLQDIDSVVGAGCKCHHTPGLAISVVKDGQVVLSRGYGVRDLIGQQPVTSSTLFGIASLTKAFTSTLLVKLLGNRKEYSVGTNVYKILGKNLFNNTLRSTYATLEDLLSHRLGIPRHTFLRLGNYSRTDLVKRVRYLPSHGAFRDSFYYSDLMYGLVTRVIEMLGNGSWEEQVEQHLFRPLGMKTSTFDSRVTGSTASLATPYVMEDGKLEKASWDFIKHWGILGGSGAIVTSADDMAQWMLFHLSGGRDQRGRVVVDASTLNDTYKARTTLDYDSATKKYFTRPKVPVTTSNDGYALGWKKGYYRGLRMLQHSGSTWGYRALITLIPDKHLGIFSSMTGVDDHFLFRLSLHDYLADVMLGEAPWLNASTICSFPAPWQRQSSRRHAPSERQSSRSHAPGEREPSSRESSHFLSLYVGRYHNEAYGDIDVTLTPDPQGLQAVFGFARWELHPTSTPNEFKAVWVKDPPRLDFVFVFKVDSRHRIFALSVPGFEQSDPPIFYRGSGSGLPFG